MYPNGIFGSTFRPQTAIVRGHLENPHGEKKIPGSNPRGGYGHMLCVSLSVWMLWLFAVTRCLALLFGCWPLVFGCRFWLLAPRVFWIAMQHIPMFGTPIAWCGDPKSTHHPMTITRGATRTVFNRNDVSCLSCVVFALRTDHPVSSWLGSAPALADKSRQMLFGAFLSGFPEGLLFHLIWQEKSVPEGLSLRHLLCFPQSHFLRSGLGRNTHRFQPKTC